MKASPNPAPKKREGFQKYIEDDIRFTFKNGQEAKAWLRTIRKLPIIGISPVAGSLLSYRKT